MARAVKEADSVSELEDMLDAEIRKKAGDLMIKELAPIVEDILRKHIETKIYGFHYSFDRGTYGRRHQLPEKVYSSMAGADTMITTSSAPPAPSRVRGGAPKMYGGAVFTGEDMSGRSSSGGSRAITGFKTGTSGSAGGFLRLLETGNMGFITRRHGYFPRPAVSSAQAEVDGSARVAAAKQRIIAKILG